MPSPEYQTRLAEWFRRWRAPMRKFLAGRGTFRIADFDDVAQEVFLRLLRYDSAELVEHPQAYVFKIASNVASEWAIRSRHRLAHDPRWLVGLVCEDRVDDVLDSEAAQREIRRAIDKLSPRERLILKLHFEEGLSQPQIAEHLSLSLRIVRRDFEKSYAKLRREINLEFPRGLKHGRV